jgi:hypothetical protein
MRGSVSQLRGWGEKKKYNVRIRGPKIETLAASSHRKGTFRGNKALMTLHTLRLPS